MSFLLINTKELHAVFQNHASYQASWVSTSTTCNSYPHIIHVNIFNIIFTKKKKNTTCYSNQEINIKIGIFFPVFQLRKKTTCIYQHHSHKKTAYYSNKEINMQTGCFFQFSNSEKQHAYTNIILIKKKTACY